MRKRNRPHTVASILALTKKQNNCLIWRGTKRSNGYGVTVFRGVQTTTHRVMYQLVHGCLPRGYEVDHICNVRDCVNPDHLQAVTHKQNMRRGLERRSTCKAGHLWTKENTYVATVKYRGGVRKQRYCRTCRAKHQKEFRKHKQRRAGEVAR